jgi:predicted RNA-binding Zn-ribbon protein involved in translation (DUF1610 family)
MSHEIIYREYENNKTESQILNEVLETVRHSGDGYGTDHIKFITDQIFENENEAVKYIDKIDTDWYGGFAVKFYDYSGAKKTKKIEEYESKIDEIIKKKNAYFHAHHVKNFTAKFIGCAKCGSKLSREHLIGNSCPLCGSDLRAASTLERLANFDKRRDEYKQKIAQEVQKQKKAAKIKWLVKFEYHS